MKRALLLAALLPLPALAVPFLVSDPTTVARVTHCVMVRTTPTSVTTEWAVESVTGGKRCKIDLANDPQTGTVTVAFKDAAAGEVGPAAAFTFPVPITGPTGLRLSPN